MSVSIRPHDPDSWAPPPEPSDPDEPNAVVIRTKGDIDLSTAERFARQVDAAVESAEGRLIVVDFTDTQFIGVIVLRLLLDLHERCLVSGLRMIIVAPDAAVRRALDIGGVSALVPISSDRSG